MSVPRHSTRRRGRPSLCKPFLDNTCSPTLGAALTTDQRGFTRKVGTHVDIGAVEVNYSINATAGSLRAATVNTAFATLLKATVTESGNPVPGVTVTFTSAT